MEAKAALRPQWSLCVPHTLITQSVYTRQAKPQQDEKRCREGESVPAGSLRASVTAFLCFKMGKSNIVRLCLKAVMITFLFAGEASVIVIC